MVLWGDHPSKYFQKKRAIFNRWTSQKSQCCCRETLKKQLEMPGSFPMQPGKRDYQRDRMIVDSIMRTSLRHHWIRNQILTQDHDSWFDSWSSWLDQRHFGKTWNEEHIAWYYDCSNVAQWWLINQLVPSLFKRDNIKITWCDMWQWSI